jgi:alanine racemase
LLSGRVAAAAVPSGRPSSEARGAREDDVRASAPDEQALPGAKAGATSVPRAVIDTSALCHNLGQVRRLVGASTDVLAMVKADAYGHGAAACVAALARAGCSKFGVVAVDEAREIAPLLDMAGGAQREVVVLGGILPDEADAAIAAGASVATQEMDVVRALGARAVAAGTQARVHVKIDTGMHRLGIGPAEAVDFVREASAVAGVRVVAICSHFALAESVTGEVTAGQLEAMLGADRALRAAGFPLLRHLANSAATMSRPEAHLDIVRPGIMLYGVSPDPALKGRAELRPVMRLLARIVRVADIATGEGIGYGHTFRTVRPSRIATVRFGYADGYPRALGNAAVASVRGVRVPNVGRICMDHSMFDVTGVHGVAAGDEIELWGTDPTVEEIAPLAGTIAYELLARVGRRVRREAT